MSLIQLTFNTLVWTPTHFPRPPTHKSHLWCKQQAFPNSEEPSQATVLTPGAFSA